VHFLADEISEFTKAVWASVLDPGITPLTEVPDPAVMGATLTACVQISGPWNGALVIRCGVDTARTAASLMLEMESGEASDEELADVVGELANMIGGNVKALVPQPARLGLPSVVEGKEYSMHLPGSRVVSRLGFEWRGAPIVVLLMQGGECELKS